MVQFRELLTRLLDAELDGRAVRVISMEDLLTVKESVRRPKDLEVAAELRALLDARKRPKA